MTDVRTAETAAAYLASSGRRHEHYEGPMTMTALIDAASADVERILDKHQSAFERITQALIAAARDDRQLRDPDLRSIFEELSAPAGDLSCS